VTGFSNKSHGVFGLSSSEYAGEFLGGRAPVRLRPGNTAGAPTSDAHQMGELYVDSQAPCGTARRPARLASGSRWLGNT
jgi:hypothetical protein